MSKEWEKWEKYCQTHLGLDSTISSGNQWHDPGDGVSRTHYTEDSFPLIIDCKYTEKNGFRLDNKFLKEWALKAAELGKRFIMPIRFHPIEKWRTEAGDSDWVVLSFQDFLELLEHMRDNQS